MEKIYVTYITDYDSTKSAGFFRKPEDALDAAEKWAKEEFGVDLEWKEMSPSSVDTFGEGAVDLLQARVYHQELYFYLAEIPLR